MARLEAPDARVEELDGRQLVVDEDVVVGARPPAPVADEQGSAASHGRQDRVISHDVVGAPEDGQHVGAGHLGGRLRAWPYRCGVEGVAVVPLGDTCGCIAVDQVVLDERLAHPREVDAGAADAAVAVDHIVFDDVIEPAPVREGVGAEALGRQSEQAERPFTRRLHRRVPDGGVRGDLLERGFGVDVDLQATGVAPEEHVAADHVVVRAVREVGGVLPARYGEEVVLHEHRVAVHAVDPPDAVVVGVVADDRDVMRELGGMDEVPVDENAGVGAPEARAAGRVGRGAGDVEALHDDVMRAREEDHPGRIGGARPVDDHVSRRTQGREADVTPVACVHLVAEAKAVVPARQHGHEIAASALIGGLLERLDREGHGQVLRLPWAGGCEVEFAHSHDGRRFVARVDGDDPRNLRLNREVVRDPVVRVLRLVERERRRGRRAGRCGGRAADRTDDRRRVLGRRGQDVRVIGATSDRDGHDCQRPVLHGMRTLWRGGQASVAADRTFHVDLRSGDGQAVSALRFTTRGVNVRAMMGELATQLETSIPPAGDRP